MWARALVISILLAGSPAHADDAPPTYDIDYHATLLPDDGEAQVDIRLRQTDAHLLELRFRVDPERHHSFDGDGELQIDDEFVYWRPPVDGGDLSLRLVIDRRRGNGGYDARMTDSWALLRADHLVPPARVRTQNRAESRATLSFTVPEGWSVQTRYGSWTGEAIALEDPSRRFVRPTGWMIAGELGVRRGDVAGRQISVAAPVGVGVRRMDALAMVRWTLPTLLEIFPGFPETLLVVGAGDPMWRGALSGPASMYMHADRPLINERGTSTMVHEMVHVAGIVHTGRGAGWIVEGLADYYSLEILRRSGVNSERRHAVSLQTLERNGRSVRRLDASSGGGAVTARAVGEFVRIDAAIREATDGAHSLDDVARALAESDETITYARLRDITESLVGAPLAVFDELPLARR